MPPRIENYQGREQSFIKHLFLNKYLESAGLCCTNRLNAEVPLSPDRLIPRLP